MTLSALASLRFLRRHRMQCALAIIGIALGVAIVIGIQTTQLSARAAFARSMSTVVGNVSHIVKAPEGPLDERALGVVRQVAPHWQVQPIIESFIDAKVGGHRQRLQLVGIDPLSQPFGQQRADWDARRLITESATAVINAETAKRLSVSVNDRLSIDYAGQALALTIIAVIDTQSSAGPRLADKALVVDISTAQEILDMPGQLTRLELAEGAHRDRETIVEKLTERLQPGALVIESRRERANAEQLTRAFYTNLDALSLLALLVGAFMINNTMAFLVIQRQSLFARLRALGVQRRHIIQQVVGEGLLLGSAGGLIGGALGFAIAGLLVEPVTQTLNDHYLNQLSDRITIDPLLWVLGVALAALGSVLASLPPAWQAASVRPAVASRPSATEAFSEKLHKLAAIGAGLLLLAGVGLLLLTSHSLVAGFAALGAILIAAMLACPQLMRALLERCDRSFANQLPLAERLALKSASRSMNRIGMAVAALMAATATSVGVGIMVASFRVSVADWLDQLLRAEIYISQQQGATRDPQINQQMVTQLERDRRIAALSKVRRHRLKTAAHDIHLTAYELPNAARPGFKILHGDPQTIWRRWDNDATVMVSEPYAWHHQTQLGDTLELTTPSGRLTVTVTGIYADYGNDRGVVALSWDNYRRHWPATALHGLGIYPRDGADLSALQRDLEAQIANTQQLIVWSKADIQRQSLAVFDRTFLITDVMTLIAASIAALGVFNALLALNLGRQREYAVLRATGLSQRSLKRSLYAHSAITAGVAVVLAIPVGSLIALILIEIINVRSFGWSMDYRWDFQAVGGPVVLAIGGALLATVYPVNRALSTPPATGLRYD